MSVKWIPVDKRLPPIEKGYKNITETVLVKLINNTYDEAFCDNRNMQWWHFICDKQAPQKLYKRVIAWAEYEKGGI